MNIITGHRGFIGSHLFSRIPNSYGVNVTDSFQFLNDFERWKDVECVYHMGAISDTTCTDLNKIYQHNINFSIQLFERCIQYKIPFKYASSASVYGETGSKMNPLNFYALSKVAVDYWILENKKRLPPHQGFRFYNVYGNGEEHKGNQASPVTQFKKQALEQGVIKIFEGSSEFVRDFICVEDVCDVIIGNKHSSGIYDLGTSNPISFENVAILIQKKYGGKIVEIPFPEHLKNKYQKYTCANADFDFRFKSVKEWLDLQPVVSLGGN